MQQIKSSKKDTTNAKKSNISVISEKYQFFSAFVRSEKDPTESIESFMNRIGMGARRPDYRAFVSGIKNITELNFNKIRMALRWDHIETAQWEELWEKDQELKSLKLKRKLNAPPVKQIHENTTQDTVVNTNAPPILEAHHCCHPDVRVLVRDFKTLTEHRHELDDAVFQRFLEFAYHVSDNKIQEFAERNNLEWGWFKDVTDTGMVEFFKTEEALETFLFENLHFDDGIISWIRKGRLYRPLRLFISEYRAAIWDPIGAKVNVSKENGSSSC